MTKSLRETFSGAGALVLWGAGLLGITALPDPILNYPAFVGLGGLAVLGWLLVLSRPEPLTGRALGVLIAGALGARLACLALDPAFSLDCFRYVFEGRVVWYQGPSFPFSHAPATAAEHGVPAHLLDRYWRGINHPGIPTIYPPVAQLSFALAGGLGELLGGHLFLLKTVLVFAELAAWAILAPLLGRGRVAALAACPILIWEVAREGHADSLSLLGLSLCVVGFQRARPRAGYAGLAVAALAKLNGLLLMPLAVRTTRRGLLIGLAILSLLALPWVLAGTDAGTGLSNYAQRWRSGDGVFSWLLTLAELMLGADYRRVAEVTITRHQLARGLVLVIFGAVYAAILIRPADLASFVPRGGLLLLLLLLLTPTLHPWYTLWLLPFVPFMGPTRPAALALVASSWLLHHAAWMERTTGDWVDLWWVRGLVHGPVWALLLYALRSRRSRSAA